MNPDLIAKSVIAQLCESMPGFNYSWFKTVEDGSRNRIIEALTKRVDAEIQIEQKEFAQFLFFWANKFHKHHEPMLDPILFVKCEYPLCKSFRETINGLGHQVATITNLDVADAPASVPHRT